MSRRMRKGGISSLDQQSNNRRKMNLQRALYEFSKWLKPVDEDD
jgi:hypothetical protein